MRTIGTMHPTENNPTPADTVTTFLMTGGSSAQASDWQSTGSTAMTNAAAAGAHIVRITPLTTAGAAYMVMANLMSTGAAAASSGTSVSSAGAANIPITGPTVFQIPGNSTGFSFFGYTSGLAIMEQWHK